MNPGSDALCIVNGTHTWPPLTNQNFNVDTNIMLLGSPYKHENAAVCFVKK